MEGVRTVRIKQNLSWRLALVPVGLALCGMAFALPVSAQTNTKEQQRKQAQQLKLQREHALLQSKVQAGRQEQLQDKQQYSMQELARKQAQQKRLAAEIAQLQAKLQAGRREQQQDKQQDMAKELARKQAQQKKLAAEIAEIQARRHKP